MTIYDFSVWLLGVGLDSWCYSIMALFIAISFIVLTVSPFLLIFGFSIKIKR